MPIPIWPAAWTTRCKGFGIEWGVWKSSNISKLNNFIWSKMTCVIRFVLCGNFQFYNKVVIFFFTCKPSFFNSFENKSIFPQILNYIIFSFAQHSFCTKCCMDCTTFYPVNLLENFSKQTERKDIIRVSMWMLILIRKINISNCFKPWTLT